MRNLVAATITVSITLVVVAACVWLAIKAAAVFVLLFVSAIAASAMAPLGQWIARVATVGRRRLPLVAGLIVAYALVAAAVATVVWFYAVSIGDDVRRLAEQAPALYGQALAALDTVRQQFTWLPDARLILGGLQSDSATAAALAGRFMGLTLGVAGFAAALVTMLVLSFYLVLEAPALEVALLRLLPKQHRAEVSSKLRFIGTRFGAWVRGQMLVAFIMGTTATVAMHLLGMPYPFFIGGIVAITDFVPLLGGTLGAIPAIAIALFQPRWQLFAVLAFFILIQQIENYVLIPRIMSRAVRISPMLTIVALLIGGTAYGIVGAFVALPLAAALQVFAPLAIRLALGQYRELDAA